MPHRSVDHLSVNQCHDYTERTNLAKELNEIIDSMQQDYVCRTLGLQVLKNRIMCNIMGLSDPQFRHFAELAATRPQEAIKKIVRAYRLNQ